MPATMCVSRASRRNQHCQVAERTFVTSLNVREACARGSQLLRGFPLARQCRCRLQGSRLDAARMNGGRQICGGRDFAGRVRAAGGPLICNAQGPFVRSNCQTHLSVSRIPTKMCSELGTRHRNATGTGCRLHFRRSVFYCSQYWLKWKNAHVWFRRHKSPLKLCYVERKPIKSSFYFFHDFSSFILKYRLIHTGKKTHWI